MSAHQHVDAIWNAIGRYGCYQRRQMLLSLPATLPLAFHIVSIVFIGIQPDHECSPPPNGSVTQYGRHLTNVTYEECSIIWKYDNNTEVTECTYGVSISVPKTYSFVTEWNLFCDRDVLSKTSQMLVLGGMFVGAFVSPLADKWGRKTVHVIFNIGLFVASLSMGFVKVFNWFLVLRFLVGMFQQGMLLAVNNIWMELCCQEDRLMVGGVVGFLWGSSVLVLALVSYLLKDYGWRYIQIALSLFSSLSLLEIFFLDESLRWLIVNKKMEKAKSIVRRAAKLNKVSLEDDIITLNQFKEEQQEATDAASSGNDLKQKPRAKSEEKWTALLLDPILRKHSLIMWLSWAVNNVTYYGIIMMSSSLSGDLYVNFVLGSVAEILFTFLLIASFKKFERKTAIIIFQCVVGISFAITTITSNFAGDILRIIETVIYVICRGAITCSFNGIYLLTPELFPTNLRNAGLGFASSIGRISAIIAPTFVYALRVGLWLPSALFGSICLLSAFLLRYIPRTKGRELPQTIEDIELWVTQGTSNKKKNDI